MANKKRNGRNRTITAIAFAAQSVRDASGKPLREVEVYPSETLWMVQKSLLETMATLDAGVIGRLRESMVPDGTPDKSVVVQVNALLLFYDACVALELDDASAQCALSLADWCDAQVLLMSREYDLAKDKATAA